MNCKQIERKLIFYLEDNLPDNIKSEISNHLNTCSECKRKLDYIQESIQMLDNDKSFEIKPFLYSRIKERIINKKSLRLPQKYLIPLAAASVITSGFFIGSLIGYYTISQSQELIFTEISIETIFNDSGLELTENILLSE